MATVFPTDQVVENGGNSTKATSGINGAATRTQKQKGIDDSTDLLTKDTLEGGAKKPEIVKVVPETPALRRKVVTSVVKPKVKLTNAIINLNDPQVVKIAEQLVQAQHDAKHQLFNLCRTAAPLTEEQQTQWHRLVETIEQNVNTFNNELVPVMNLTPHVAQQLGLEQKHDSFEEKKDADALREIARKMDSRALRGMQRAEVLTKVVATKLLSPMQESVLMTNEEALVRKSMNRPVVDGDTNKQVDGDADKQADGDHDKQVDGDTDKQVDGDTNKQVDGDTNKQVDGDTDKQVDGDTNMQVDGDTDKQVDGDTNKQVDGDTDKQVAVKKTLRMMEVGKASEKQVMADNEKPVEAYDRELWTDNKDLDELMSRKGLQMVPKHPLVMDNVKECFEHNVIMENVGEPNMVGIPVENIRAKDERTMEENAIWNFQQIRINYAEAHIRQLEAKIAALQLTQACQE